MKLIFYLLFLLNSTLFSNTNNILQIKINDAITPATTQYFKESLIKANEINAKFVLIELDTPGGLLSSTRILVQDILNSKIPIVMYVSPKGARAASAGTFLMYASHIAVMAEGTHIGAATPVNVMQNQPLSNKKNENNDLEKIKSAMEKKVLNDTIAYIKSIAEHRKRNIDWAIEAVKDGKSISSTEALEKEVIDFMANDIIELLKKIDKKDVKINNQIVKIDTSNANIVFFNASWKIKFLMSIANPNIAYIFLILAMYGILFEMMNPGSIFPGVIGAVSALIALYALNILPFNYVGLLLILLGIALMIMELFLSGFGIMGIAGTIAFIFGSILLFDERILGSAISIPLIIAFSVVSLGFFIFLLGFVIKSRALNPVSGISTMSGDIVIITEINDNEYKILHNGELWSAKSDEKFSIGDDAVVDSVDGLVVHIRRIK